MNRLIAFVMLTTWLWSATTFAAGKVLITNSPTQEILQYNLDGTFDKVFATNVTSPWGLALNPANGQVFVASGGSNGKVLRFNANGSAAGTIPITGSIGPSSLRFGPDGMLYVCSTSLNSVRVYNPSTGAFIREAAKASSGLRYPAGLAWAPDGTLLVSSGQTQQVKRFNPNTGAFIGNLVTDSAFNSVSGPTGLVLSSDSKSLLVGSFAASQIRQYDLQTGAFERVLVSGVSARGVLGLAWLPNGELLAAAAQSFRVQRIDATTGNNLGTFGDDRITGPFDILVVPAPAAAILFAGFFARSMAHRRSRASSFPARSIPGAQD